MKIELKKCKKDSDFNNNEMFDLAEIRGHKKKVNFVVLPGLFCNGVFLQSGKIHVFTYTPKTFYIDIKK